jgi:hypothetical protein
MRNQARIRSLNGVKEHYCFKCEAWKPVHLFNARCKSPNLTQCRACESIRKREWYKRNRERLLKESRELTKHLHKTLSKPPRERWSCTHGVVPVAAVHRWLQHIYENMEKEHGAGSWSMVAGLTGISERRIWEFRTYCDDENKMAAYDVAEKVARAAGLNAELELMDLVEPGEEHWGPRDERYCERCGRTDVPHHAKGCCRPCYFAMRHYQRENTAPRPPRWERWSTYHDFCRVCSSREHPHSRRGVCKSCLASLMHDYGRPMGLSPSQLFERMGFHKDRG